MKGAYAPKSFALPDRLMFPLRRKGARGEGGCERVSWDSAMDGIAECLTQVIQRHGPEALAVASSVANHGNDNDLSRRFTNLVGAPNFISGTAYCTGNTAAVNRMVDGWYPRGDSLDVKCIVLFGHDPRRHSWALEYKSIKTAQAQGAKLIVLDPRKSQNAEAADLWLPLRAGTGAAMMLGWLHLIIEEGLYDKDFMRDWTVGFNPGARSDTELELHHLLSDAQKAKQLGADQFPMFTYRGMKALGDATEKVWGSRYAILVGGTYMANPMAVFNRRSLLSYPET